MRLTEKLSGYNEVDVAGVVRAPHRVRSYKDTSHKLRASKGNKLQHMQAKREAVEASTTNACDKLLKQEARARERDIKRKAAKARRAKQKKS